MRSHQGHHDRDVQERQRRAQPEGAPGEGRPLEQILRDDARLLEVVVGDDQDQARRRDLEADPMRDPGLAQRLFDPSDVLRPLGREQDRIAQG
jgi:hypothetical protein